MKDLIKEKRIWTTYDGKQIEIDKLHHSHLSNIYYYATFGAILYKEAFNGVYQHQRRFAKLEIEKRFDGVILPYKPKWTWEIDVLNKLKAISPEGNIYLNKELIGKID